MLLYLGYGLLGLVLLRLAPEAPLGWILFNLFLFQLFLVLTILPHELGHAIMARLCGMRVFRIQVGTGKKLLKTRLFGIDTEFHAIPLGGFAVASHVGTKSIRAKQFAFILAGPMVNALLAFVGWMLFKERIEWRVSQMESGVHPSALFVYANLIVLVENLIPKEFKTSFGTVASDGKQLWKALTMKRDDVEALRVVTFRIEAALCYEKGDFDGAKVWIEKGLEADPKNWTLKNLRATITLYDGRHQEAREEFLQCLEATNDIPMMRPLFLNNIAYADALIGDPALFEEADAISKEALEALGWAPSIMGTRGTVLLVMGQPAEAIPLLTQALATAHDFISKAQSACWLAEAEALLGNHESAANYLEEARKLNPLCPLLGRAETALAAALDASPETT